jgi:hypothetical protein
MSCVNLRLFYRVCEIEPGLLRANTPIAILRFDWSVL